MDEKVVGTITINDEYNDDWIRQSPGYRESEERIHDMLAEEHARRRATPKIVYAPEAPEVPNIHGVSARTLYDTEHAQVTMVTLQPGEALKLHVTPVDVFIYVLEGRGIVEIGDAQQPVSVDMLIESPASIPHRLMNDSDAVFRFLVVKVPRPAQTKKPL